MIKVRINGDLWKIVIAADLVSERGEHAEAGGLTDFDNKTISIDPTCLDIETIRHELFHAYAFYLHLADSNDISYADIEEIYAGWFANRAQSVLKQAARVFKKLRSMNVRG